MVKRSDSKPVPPTGSGRIPVLKAPSSKDREEFLNTIKSKHGGESIVEMNDELASRQHKVIPSGSILLDQALGGGWPFGRLVEVFGPAAAGKTTLALHAIASMQKHGGTAAFIDVEHAFSPIYAKALGVDVGAMAFSQPSSGEEALSIFEDLAMSNMYNLIVLDSIAGLATQAELEGEMGELKVGALARLMSNSLKKLTPAVAKSNNCIGFFVNQVRVLNIGGYGNPEDTPGGKALKFYSSIRAEVRAGKKSGPEDKPTGQKTTVNIKKNKLAPPFRSVELDLVYGKGFWATGEILDLAAEFEIVKKSGAWYYNGEDRIAQGRENAAAALEAKPELLAEIEAKVREKLA